MKDWVGAYGKIAGIGAGAGFLLSLLIGLLSGNPFGTVMLRALLFALLFGGFGVGAQVVFGRFLPEFSGGAGEEPPRGGIDITLPEENPHAASQGARAAETGEGTTEDGVTEAEALAGSGPTEGEPPSELEPPGSEDPAAVEAVEEDGVPPAAPAGAAEQAARKPEADRPARRADPLPDLDSLGLGGARGAASGGGRAGTSRPRQQPGGAGDFSGEDPAIIAQAIRTVLKKDEKG